MKIAIDARFWDKETAGLGRYTQEFIKNLAKIDHQNEYLIILLEKDLLDFKKIIKQKNFSAFGVKSNHYSIAEQIKLPSELKKQKFDFIHFLNFNHPTFWRKPFICTIHDLTLYFFPSRSKKDVIHQLGFRKVVKHAVQKSIKIITASQRTKDDIIGLFKTEPSKIEVIYEGAADGYKVLPQKEINNFLKKNKIDKPYLLYVGQWRPHKNLIRLLKAYDKLKKEKKFTGYLVLTGKENDSWKEVSETINKLNLEKDILRPGFVPENELVYWYNGALAFIFPSLQEGFGIPPLESMASGTPVIAANSSCIPEVCGKAAKYFNPYSIKNMTDVINKTISDKKALTNLRKNGFQQVKKYSWQKMALGILKLYKEVYNNLK